MQNMHRMLFAVCSLQSKHIEIGFYVLINFYFALNFKDCQIQIPFENFFQIDDCDRSFFKDVYAMVHCVVKNYQNPFSVSLYSFGEAESRRLANPSRVVFAPNPL